MDFDDLLVLWLKLLQNMPTCAALSAPLPIHPRRRNQDTNKLQSDLIDLLAERNKNVMVVGDDAQSIYAWRGANFQNIIRFPDRYPGQGLQNRNQLPQHAGNPDRGQRRHRRERRAVR